MNDQQHPGETGDMHALTGAYVVDALDEGERARFEAHLEHCADCRAEVAELSETTAMLAADEVAPPPSLRDSVLSAIDTVRPLPPLTSQLPATPPEEAATAPVPAPVPINTRRSDAAGRRARRRFLGGPTLLVAASLVLLAMVTGLLVTQPWSADEVAPAPTATERVLDADDATRVQKTFRDGSSATVVVSRSEGRAVILTEQMAGAPDGKVYELWLQSPEGDMLPAGLMPDDPDSTVLLDGDASQATAVGITVEPDGGSEEPTTPPIAVFELDV